MSLAQITRDYIRVLENCEQDSQQEMRRYQISLLERLCRHARATVPYYKDRLDVLFSSNDEFNMDRWEEVPILTRQDLIQNQEALTSTNSPKNFGQIMIAKTSGSTGEPVTAKITQMESMIARTIYHRFFSWHQFDPSKKLARIISRPFDQKDSGEYEKDYWGSIYRDSDQRGRVYGFNGQDPINEQLEWLERTKPDYLTINPRLGLEIANTYQERSQSPSYNLKGIHAFGEMRSNLADRQMKEVFGRIPRSIYSAEETGHMAVQCPLTGQYHVSDEVNLLEVVNDDNRSVADQEIGRILVTPFYGYAMPRIRYEIGDEAVNSHHCKCRRPHSVLKEIAGRISHLFYLPDGKKIRPNRDLITKASEHLNAVAVQIAQTGRRTIEIRYNPNKQSQIPVDEQAMKSEITKSMDFQADVRIVRVDRIPANARGKREDFVCEYVHK